MAEDRSFHGSPATGGRSAGRVTVLAIVAVIAFVGIAIAKPWGDPAGPAPSGGLPGPGAAAISPSAAPAASSPATASDTPRAGPLEGASPTAAVRPLPIAFTAPLVPASAVATATWTALDWRRLAPDDPLALVTSIVPWRRGFVAVGRIAAPPATPVWTSEDGTRWNTLPFNTSSTFWPGSAVIGVAAIGTGLVALTETVEFCAEPCPLTFELPIVSWTSPDGRAWTPHLLPPEWLARPSGQPPLLAIGTAGLVVASAGRAARLATSTDGSHWRLVPAAGFPARFTLTDLRGTGTGYVAVGRWLAADGRNEVGSLRSSDGRTWPGTPTILPVSPASKADVGPAVISLVVGRDGMIAVGRDVMARDITRWSSSPDGSRWATMPAFSPLGPTTCNEGCGILPYGTLIGDGERMVALRGGTDAGVWASSDGLTWTRLRAGGDVPVEQAATAVLLPGGLLLTDGTTTWFGEAQAP